MATQEPTPGQIMRANYQAANKAEDEKRKAEREQWLSSALDISPDAARDLTKLIKDRLEDIFGQIHEVEQLILEAHDRRAWQALGYSTWEQYVKKEFALSRSRSYQLLDQARVVNRLREAADSAIGSLDRQLPAPIGHAASDSSPIHISIREAQRLKPQLPEAQAEMRELVSEGTPPDQAIQAVVERRGSPPQVIQIEKQSDRTHPKEPYAEDPEAPEGEEAYLNQCERDPSRMADWEAKWKARDKFEKEAMAFKKAADAIRELASARRNRRSYKTWVPKCKSWAADVEGSSDIRNRGLQRVIDDGLKVEIKHIDAAIAYLQEVKEYLEEG
jgi:membrane-associated HD superfamily phosphohydrolase